MARFFGWVLLSLGLYRYFVAGEAGWKVFEVIVTSDIFLLFLFVAFLVASAVFGGSEERA